MIEKFIKDIEYKMQIMGINKAELARKTRVPPASITRLLQSPVGKEKYKHIALHHIIKVVEYLFEKGSIEKLINYIYCANGRNMRAGVEYLWSNHKFDEVEKILQLLQEGNAESQTFANLYDLLRKRYYQKITPCDMRQIANKNKLEKDSIKSLTSLIRMYSYYDENRYHLLEEEAQEGLELHRNLKCTTLKTSYIFRVSQLLVPIKLYKYGDTNTCQKLCEEIINNPLNNYFFKAFAYVYLSKVHTFDDFDKSMKYLDYAEDYYHKSGYMLGLETVKFNRDFLLNHWGQYDCVLLENSDDYVCNRHGIVYNLIQQGKNKEASSLLDEIKVGELDDWNKGFHYYYRGLIYNSIEDYCKSVIYFKECSDKYYVRLPIDKLKEKGIDAAVINALKV